MRHQSAKPPKSQGPDFSHIRNYTGPPDGRSAPSHRWLVRPLGALISSLEYRLVVENPEELNHTGKRIYCPTHPRLFDPLFVERLSDRDMRYMAADRIMIGLPGRLITMAGAFPVNTNKASIATLKHSLELVEAGIGLAVFPEARNSPDPNTVGPLKGGMGYLAVKGGAEAVVPIAIHYRPDNQLRIGERLLGLGLTAAVGLGAYLATQGSPLAQAFGAVATGALAGTFTGATIARARTENPNYENTTAKFQAGLKWGLIGSLIGATVGGLVSGSVAGQFLTGVLGTASFLGLATAFSSREVCSVRIGSELVVDDYVSGYGRREAMTKIDEDLHTSLGQMKALQSGQPYDETAPKLRPD